MALAVALTGLTPAPAEASGRTARVLAGVAAGALIYAALEDASHSRYNPPGPYSRQHPREAYDDGYYDGYADGRYTGRREGYNAGWNKGYGTGYRDGRTDERYVNRIGTPYTRPVARTNRAYGYY